MAGETQENRRNHQPQNSAAPLVTENHIAQFSKKIEGRVTDKLSQDFSGTESRILCALSKLWSQFCVHNCGHSQEPLRDHSGSLM